MPRKRPRAPRRQPTSETAALARRGRRTARKAGHEVERNALKAARVIKRNADNPWLERAARLGYLVRGLLYGAMGAFGVGFAFGIYHKTTDQRGTLYLLRSAPALEVTAVGFVIVGLAGYTIWGFVRAIYDPLRRGDEPQGVAARLGFAWSGLSYLGMLVFTIQLLLGLSKGDGSDSVEKSVRFLLSHRFGTIFTGVVGVIAILVGLGQFADAYRGSWIKDMQLRKMSEQEEAIAGGLGRFGFVARGVIFGLLGWFVLLAAINHDAARAHGIGATFQYLAEQPFGHLLLFVVSLGFIALGLHSFACARWIRMTVPD
ncbi:MAG: DUF1206 domain-containing protein [Candidatus Dormibacteria bacterium]